MPLTGFLLETVYFEQGIQLLELFVIHVAVGFILRLFIFVIQQWNKQTVREHCTILFYYNLVNDE